MPRPSFGLLALALLLPACENRAPNTGSTQPTAVAPNSTPSAAATATPAVTTTQPDRVPADRPMTVGHIRVSVKKVTIGQVPLKATDGSITYSDEPRLMVALRVENVSDKKQSGYDTWVPDLDAAKTVAKLIDDRGAELKRATLGFGNNVKDRTVLDTLTPGKVIGDLLLFEPPADGVKHLDLELPGANCGVKGTFRFRIDFATIVRTK